MRRVGFDDGGHAGAVGEAGEPEVERALLARPDAGMVALLPGFQRGHRAEHALLADLHAAADAAILDEGGADEVLSLIHI